MQVGDLLISKHGTHLAIALAVEPVIVQVYILSNQKIYWFSRFAYEVYNASR